MAGGVGSLQRNLALPSGGAPRNGGLRSAQRLGATTGGCFGRIARSLGVIPPFPVRSHGTGQPLLWTWPWSSARVGRQRHAAARTCFVFALAQLCERMRGSNSAGGGLKSSMFFLCVKSWIPRVGGDLSQKPAATPPPNWYFGDRFHHMADDRKDGGAGSRLGVQQQKPAALLHDRLAKCLAVPRLRNANNGTLMDKTPADAKISSSLSDIIKSKVTTAITADRASMLALTLAFWKPCTRSPL